MFKLRHCVDEQMADYGPETKGADLVDKMRLARATGQTTFAQHDMGIATEISIGSTDFSGKKINSSVSNQMQNLRKWQQRVRVTSPPVSYTHLRAHETSLHLV